MKEQSNNRTIEQSNNRTIEQSNNRTIEQSNNRTIEQSNNRTIEQEAEFDDYAQDYTSKLEENISAILKGNSHEYFNQYKIFYLREIFNTQKNESPLKILDYGCGVGLFSRTIFNAFPDTIIHGFDVSSESVKLVPPEICINNNKFTSNLDDLDSDYDIAMLITVLHHVIPVSERPGVINNIYKRLKPGGKLIINELNMTNPLTRKLVNSLPIDANAIMLKPRECIDLLTHAGFKNINNKYVIFFPKQLGTFRVLDKFISWLPLGAQYLTIGEK